MWVNDKSLVSEGEHGDVSSTVAKSDSFGVREIINLSNQFLFFMIVELVGDVAGIDTVTTKFGGSTVVEVSMGVFGDSLDNEINGPGYQHYNIARLLKEGKKRENKRLYSFLGNKVESETLDCFLVHTLDTSGAEFGGAPPGLGIGDLTTFVEFSDRHILLVKVSGEKAAHGGRVVKVGHGVSRVDGLDNVKEGVVGHGHIIRNEYFEWFRRGS